MISFLFNGQLLVQYLYPHSLLAKIISACLSRNCSLLESGERRFLPRGRAAPPSFEWSVKSAFNLPGKMISSSSIFLCQSRDAMPWTVFILRTSPPAPHPQTRHTMPPHTCVCLCRQIWRIIFYNNTFLHDSVVFSSEVEDCAGSVIVTLVLLDIVNNFQFYEVT